MVGLGGFAVDVSVMSALIYGFALAQSDAQLIGSRTVAWAAAIFVTYFLNARYTFGASIRHSRFLNYLLIQGIGAGINLGTFSVLILAGPFAEQPILAMVIGNVLATINNFLLVRKFVYRFHPEVEDPE